ncbi:MAG TPA: Hsp20/alpha crystallin family protein [Casimicrobiaceae bacterium]|nr:Hsp20/alpha crystallin family protein [Casimicrobiaceae bacterium]
MNQLQSFDPFADTGFDELFRGFFQPVRAGSQASRALPIKMDVIENEQGYLVQAEIPGVRKEDIHVTIDGNQVTISAETKRETEQREGARVLRTERFYGNLQRSFALPVELDEAASTAKYDNGVLELTLARKAQTAGRKLAIQ